MPVSSKAGETTPRVREICAAPHAAEPDCGVVTMDSGLVTGHSGQA